MHLRKWFSLWILTGLLAVLFASLPGAFARAQSNSPLVLELTANGPLTPAMEDYLLRGLSAADQRGAKLVILKLNTPGGSIDLMNKMVQDIRSSSVPVVVYVAPNGAMAASAGSLITMAGQASAMAPETAIGAASPVGGSGQDLPQTEALKQKEITSATAASLTQRRGQQAVALATDMINNAKAVSAQDAKSAGLIDFIASSDQDLLRQINGFTVEMASGQQTIDTTNATITPFQPTFIEQFLQILTDPNIVFILLNVGVIAILIELSHPGGWIAGFTGVVCLALATYGLDILPVNWFGLIFMATAFVLFILDIKAPTHGALTAAGVASFIVGALVLFNSPNVPTVQRVSVPLVVGSSLATGGLFFAILIFALRAQRAPIQTGLDRLVGKVGIARRDISPHGTVQVGGELWSADLESGEETIPEGARVEVVRVKGIRLFVRKAD